MLEKHGIKGRVIEIRMPEAGNIWHEGLRTNISTNGRHVAVEVDGIVYDNIHKQGIPRAEWEQQFLSIYGGFESFKVTEEEFRKWLKQLHEEQAW